MKQDAFIFDIDGTLANNDHRLHYILNKPKDYDKFYAESINDDVYKDVARILDMCNRSFSKILIVTGRPEEYRGMCEEWFKKHFIYYKTMYMRQTGDYRKDYIVKKEIYETQIKDKYNILGVFEDRNDCVQMWRELGLTCFQPKVTE